MNIGEHSILLIYINILDTFITFTLDQIKYEEKKVTLYIKNGIHYKLHKMVLIKETYIEIDKKEFNLNTNIIIELQ